MCFKFYFDDATKNFVRKPLIIVHCCISHKKFEAQRVLRTIAYKTNINYSYLQVICFSSLKAKEIEYAKITGMRSKSTGIVFETTQGFD